MIAKLVTAKELAQRYALHPKTVWKYARCGLLPKINLARRCIRFDLEKCDAALERRSTRGSVLIPMCALIFAANLLPINLAFLATKWQQVSHERRSTGFLNRLSRFNSGWGHVLFRAARVAPAQ